MVSYYPELSLITWLLPLNSFLFFLVASYVISFHLLCLVRLLFAKQFLHTKSFCFGWILHVCVQHFSQRLGNLLCGKWVVCRPLTKALCAVIDWYLLVVVYTLWQFADDVACMTLVMCRALESEEVKQYSTYCKSNYFILMWGGDWGLDIFGLVIYLQKPVVDLVGKSCDKCT